MWPIVEEVCPLMDMFGSSSLPSVMFYNEEGAVTVFIVAEMHSIRYLE